MEQTTSAQAAPAASGAPGGAPAGGLTAEKMELQQEMNRQQQLLRQQQRLQQQEQQMPLKSPRNAQAQGNTKFISVDDVQNVLDDNSRYIIQIMEMNDMARQARGMARTELAMNIDKLRKQLNSNLMVLAKWADDSIEAPPPQRTAAAASVAAPTAPSATTNESMQGTVEKEKNDAIEQKTEEENTTEGKETTSTKMEVEQPDVPTKEDMMEEKPAP